MEGDTVRGQPAAEPLRGVEGGGVPGGRTCNGRGGAGVRVGTGEEEAEVTGVVREGKKDTVSHTEELSLVRKVLFSLKYTYF